METYMKLNKIYCKNIRKILNNQINLIIENKGNKSYKNLCYHIIKQKK